MLLFLTMTLSAQKFTTKIDDMTNDIIKQTSLEYFQMDMESWGLFKFKKGKTNLYLDIRIGFKSNSIFSVGKGDKLIIKFKDNSTLILISPSYEITGIGDAAKGIVASGEYGIRLFYRLDESTIETLKTKTIIKMRLYTTKDYRELIIKPKHSKKIIKAINFF